MKELELVSFDAEKVEEDKVLISYETNREYRNQGYASLGLNLLKEHLFGEEMLILELIHLSGDFSRKVAQNAGFVDYGPNNLEYYFVVNPNSEDIIKAKMAELNPESSEYKKLNRKLQKIEALKLREAASKEKLARKLEQLKNDIELIDNEEHKRELEIEIQHLKKVLGKSAKIAR